MDDINQLSYVLSQLDKRDLGITTKNDPTYQDAPSYYDLDEYGELTDDAKVELLDDVNEYIGDGAVSFEDATDMWINDACLDCKLDFKDNLRTQFKPKPVVDQIEAVEVPKNLQENVKVEKVLTSSNGKFKKGEIYVNGNGAMIRITNYTKSGTPQYDIGMPTDFVTGTYTCRGMASDEELQALLDNNGYMKVSESKKLEFYDPIESKLPDLASDVAEFIWNFDPEYFDANWESTETAFDEFLYDLVEKDSRDDVIKRINTIKENSKDNNVLVDSADKLIARINEFGEELLEEAEYKMTPIPRELKEPSKAKPWTEGMWQDYYQRMNETVREVYKVDGDSSDYIKSQMERFNIDMELNKQNLKDIADKIAAAYADGKEKQYKALNESYTHRLAEENTKSANLISDMFRSDDFDSESKQGQIVMRTSEVFNALSDLGYNVQVSFDNGESQSAILLGEQGGKAMITITDPTQPLKAFASGNFELTEANIEILNDISKQITSL